MKYAFPWFLLLIPVLGMGQVVRDSSQFYADYLEDQFYIGLTYNFLFDKPEGVSQRNLSYGLQGGFIKDIPINGDRTVALGLGVGYGLYSYYSNLQSFELEDGFAYRILDGDERYKRSKVETHMLEIPVQFRWRNSTTLSHKFWRLYTGFKMGYVIGARSKFVSETNRFSFYNTDVNDFQYGLTLDFGYNTFNIHFYYALNKLFGNGTLVNSEEVGLRPLRVGLIFYIL